MKKPAAAPDAAVPEASAEAAAPKAKISKAKAKAKSKAKAKAKAASKGKNAAAAAAEAKADKDAQPSLGKRKTKAQRSCWLSGLPLRSPIASYITSQPTASACASSTQTRPEKGNDGSLRSA